jgi:chaperonin GroES
MSITTEVPSIERANHLIRVARLKPLGDKVLLRPYQEKDERLVQTPELFRQSNRAEVLGVGEKVETLRKGDRVIYGAYSAQEIEVDEEKLLLISIHDIWLKL